MSNGAQRIVRADVGHLEPWAQMRAALWSDADPADHREDIVAMLADEGRLAAFIAVNGQGDAIGFVEAALRHDYVNGCDTSPVLFVEGLYVAPDARRSGVARNLIDAVISWGRSKSCTEMASDADIANTASHGFHHAVGFAETERVVYFRRIIG